jgi:hypothetical protein
MPQKMERVLILAKTYPSPSSSYVETSCVAGITQKGEMRRLYPVPFRLLEEGQQFRKWQWIDVRTEKAPSDHRPESHRVHVDTLSCLDQITTKNLWSDRRVWLEKIPTYGSLDEVNSARLNENISMALLQPTSIDHLEITKARNEDWTEEERTKLIRQQLQGNLFSEPDENDEPRLLRKVPYDFYYHFTCETKQGPVKSRLKIIDWEACALYWNCISSHGPNWQAPFREKLETKLRKTDLQFLIGNQHRFQHQWLIISLIYPPKLDKTTPLQQPLF